MTQVVVVTGLSGAGRSVAAGALEDAGWFVIDNLPADLVPKVAELATSSSTSYAKVGLVLAGYDLNMADQVEALREQLDDLRIVFLEASNDTLIRRYESTKRRHPLSSEDLRLSAAIVTEREQLLPARQVADLVIDTSDLNPHQLREQINEHFADTDGNDAMRLSVSSFGFKHGLPHDVDMVIDCRFLPNPHWDEELRPFSGRDPQVKEFVLERDVTQRFIKNLLALLDDLLPAYVEEGKSYFSLAFGCTGGRHRSVAVAEDIAAALENRSWVPRVNHRDIER